MRRILIDSDVILDLFVAREPHHTIALHFFTHLEIERGGIAATASPVALANVAYVLAKLKDKAYAVGKLRELRTLIGVSPIDQSAVDRALARPHRDFEDALQRECALDNEIGILVTRNTRDHPKDTTQILTPFDVMRLHSTEQEQFCS
ncbi:MAG: PIN domain-containing protein [Spirochaetaceae bacterium]|nr:PIN domain-containing protein [Spirochaetaceae bacterium]